MSKYGRKRVAVPAGFEIIEPTLTALENDLREKIANPQSGIRKEESLWPIHQINWQKSRYVYDMYYIHHRISKDVFDYCISQKLVDTALTAQWRNPGYERLCCMYAINRSNFKFSTVCKCRVPIGQLSSSNNIDDVKDPNCGCRGCCSGSGGRDNIFGNQYGVLLARDDNDDNSKLDDDGKEEKVIKRKIDHDGEEEKVIKRKIDDDGGGERVVRARDDDDDDT